MRVFAVLLPLLLLLLAACGDNSDSVPTAAPTSPPVAGVTASPAPPGTPGATETPAVTPTPETAVIDAETFPTLQTIAESSLEGLQFLEWQSSGRLLAASNNEAVLIDPATGDSSSVFATEGDQSIRALSPQGTIAVSADDRSVEIYNVSGFLQTTIDAGAQFGSVSLAPEGLFLAVSRLDEIQVDVWSIPDNRLVNELTGFETAAPVYSGNLEAEGSMVWRSRGTVALSDITSGQLGPAMQHEEFVSGSVLDAEGAILVTTWGETATLWDPGTGERIEDMDQGSIALQPALLLDSDLLLVATEAGVRLWDVAGSVQVATVETDSRQIAVSEEGHYLATADQDGNLQVWAPDNQ